MIEMTALKKEDVATELTTTMVMDAYGHPHRRAGKEWRSDDCPRCGQGTKRRGKLSLSAHKFLCHSCGEHGDVFTLVALFDDLDVRSDFPTVVKVAAELAGITPDTSEEARARRRAVFERRRTAEESRQAELRRRAEAGAPAVWATLAPTSEKGMAYLRSRGLEAAAGDVRFSRDRACIALRAFDGIITNVVGRLLRDGEPKVSGLADCSTFGTFGDVTKLKDTRGEIVLCEGLADWLTARVRWPDRLVLGAHGAGRLPDIAQLLAPRAARAKRQIVLVAHRDQTGLRHSDRAKSRALEAGLPVDLVRVFDVAPHNDLNDFHRAEGLT